MWWKCPPWLQFRHTRSRPRTGSRQRLHVTTFWQRPHLILEDPTAPDPGPAISPLSLGPSQAAQCASVAHSKSLSVLVPRKGTRLARDPSVDGDRVGGGEGGEGAAGDPVAAIDSEEGRAQWLARGGDGERMVGEMYNRSKAPGFLCPSAPATRRSTGGTRSAAPPPPPPPPPPRGLMRMPPRERASYFNNSALCWSTWRQNSQLA
mmetsp:Transcript_15067/g.28680  ORF Transcript_15067/g.28680 Transcript_15067/m.28680 type:complete len:206 (-) Transcript_15067:209-826(-)